MAYSTIEHAPPSNTYLNIGYTRIALARARLIEFGPLLEFLPLHPEPDYPPELAKNARKVLKLAVGKQRIEMRMEWDNKRNATRAHLMKIAIAEKWGHYESVSDTTYGRKYLRSCYMVPFYEVQAWLLEHVEDELRYMVRTYDFEELGGYITDAWKNAVEPVLKTLVTLKRTYDDFLDMNTATIQQRPWKKARVEDE